MIFNLILLAFEDSVGADEFHTDVLAVVPSTQGMGIGTALMLKAEEKAESTGKRMMSLGVIAENEGAIRLYERLGYRTTRTWRGFLVRLASNSDRGATHGETNRRRQNALKLRKRSKE